MGSMGKELVGGKKRQEASVLCRAFVCVCVCVCVCWAVCERLPVRSLSAQDVIGACRNVRPAVCFLCLITITGSLCSIVLLVYLSCTACLVFVLFSLSAEPVSLITTDEAVFNFKIKPAGHFKAKNLILLHFIFKAFISMLHTCSYMFWKANSFNIPL